MRVVFMGTPEFAVPSLRALASAHDVVLVVTRPDAVRARGKRLEPSSVKIAAEELGLEVLETSRMTPEVQDKLSAAAADVFCVAAYGCILPDTMLSMAPLGCVNVHASLLPRWRGAAPIQRAILAGDSETGVSIMRIGKGVDTGPYCAQASCSIEDKTTTELTDELAHLGADLLVKTLPALADGTLDWVEQDEAYVTHAAKVEKSEMHLDPSVTAEQNLRIVRAATDAAPARLSVGNRKLRACTVCALPEEASVSVDAGFARFVSGHVYVGCADRPLELLRVKPDGKREMDASAWAAGFRELKQGVLWARD